MSESKKVHPAVQAELESLKVHQVAYEKSIGEREDNPANSTDPGFAKVTGEEKVALAEIEARIAELNKNKK
jgi:hypothetical protein